MSMICGLDEMKYQRLCISHEIGTFPKEADLHKNEKKKSNHKIVNQKCLNLLVSKIFKIYIPVFQ